MRIYQDKTKSPEDRAKDLLSIMTVDEKLDQIVSCGCNNVKELADRLDNGEKFTVSGTYTFRSMNPEDFNRLQKHMVEDTRLGIPAILAVENTHGVCYPSATIFPTSGCMAATFDDNLVNKMAKASGEEAYALGYRQVYAPNVDVSRDPRWGRTEENYGEDPYLSAKMGLAYVKGVQSQKVAATVKHYIAYGLGEAGLNLTPAHVGEREIRDNMLVPFDWAVRKGKAWSVMPSYNEIDGEPVHASKKWMIDVLRKELKFDGMVITDYGATHMFKDFHRICETNLEVGKIALDNEIDFEASAACGYDENFRKAVKNGEIPIEKVDVLVKHVLTLKFRVGLFENPYIDVNDFKKVHTKEKIALSRKIAERGITLLKNDGTLPIKDRKPKIALLGPNADVAQMGNYMFYRIMDKDCDDCSADHAYTLRKALAEKYGEKNINYAKGSDFVFDIEGEEEKVKECIDNSEIIILALGDNSAESTGGNQGAAAERDTSKPTVTSGEGFDMHYIELPPAQRKLFELAKASGKPTVMILYGGKPHAIEEELPYLSAVVQMYGAGEEGNKALVDILSGKVCPSGRLPFSIPRSTGHIPTFYNYKPSARGACYKLHGSKDKPGMDYVLSDPSALFWFGHGLSYTTFEYKNLKAEDMGNLKVKVSVSVKNTGDMNAETSVLLFTSCKYRPITPEVKKLVAFKRIKLNKGEEKEVAFVLDKESFSYTGVNMKKAVAYGKYDFMVEDVTTEFELKK